MLRIEKNNAWVGVILSFFVQGLGQLYMGKTQRGVIVFIIGYSPVVTNFILLALSITGHPLELGIIPWLLSLGFVPIFMLFLPYWAFLLLYGFSAWINGSIAFSSMPALSIGFPLLITAIWVSQIYDAYRIKVID